MAIAILQDDEQVASTKTWVSRLFSAFVAARQKQADAWLAHLATQHSGMAKARAEQARAELRMYSI
jgi:hypothetical protein